MRCERPVPERSHLTLMDDFDVGYRTAATAQQQPRPACPLPAPYQTFKHADGKVCFWRFPVGHVGK